MLLLWPGEVRRKREDDSGQIGPALFVIMAMRNAHSLAYLDYVLTF